MESELIAIGIVLLVVCAVLLAGLGAGPSPLVVHMVSVRVGSQAHLIADELAARLPR